MSGIHYIKHLRENDDLNISEITIGSFGKTKKYTDGEIDPSDIDTICTHCQFMLRGR